MAHELAQPLTAAHNFLAVATTFLDQGRLSDSHFRDALKGAAAQVERAVEVLKRMQDLSAGRRLERSPIDLNSIVYDAVAQLKSGFRIHGVEIKSNLMPDLHWAEGDKTLIRQVVVNLLRNAMEAIECEPVSRRIIEVSTTQAPGGMVQVSVSDRGPGLSNKDLQAIFEPFHTTKPSGLGLGLAISRSIIEANLGTIWAEGRAGGGAVFSFTLPTAPGEKP